jgi:hypothetical protein
MEKRIAIARMSPMGFQQASAIFLSKSRTRQSFIGLSIGEWKVKFQKSLPYYVVETRNLEY